MGQVTALLTSIGWTLPVLPELDDLTVGKPSDSLASELGTSAHLPSTICDGSHPVSAHSALKSGAHCLPACVWTPHVIRQHVSISGSNLPCNVHPLLQFSPLEFLQSKSSLSFHRIPGPRAFSSPRKPLQVLQLFARVSPPNSYAFHQGSCWHECALSWVWPEEWWCVSHPPPPLNKSPCSHLSPSSPLSCSLHLQEMGHLS